MDIFLFYIFFESILIPMFILIGIWGSRKRKIHAAYLLFFYTLIGSFFMLISIILIYSYTSTTNLFVLYNTQFPFHRESLIWIFLFLSFSIKIPMFPFHIWLPEAHVEAPTEGSVVLAGLLLKLGSYGFIRILIPFSLSKTFYFLPFIFLISSLGIIYTSLTTLRQVDLKRIIAYSSIAHMNIAILGLFSMNINSINGSILLMIGHGLISSSLFFIIGIIYDRFKTRIIQYYSGLIYNAPILIILFFFIIVSNFSFPGSINFVSEFLIFLGVLENYNLYLFIIISIGVILCTLYSILLYNKISFGLITKYNVFMSDVTRLEFFLLIPFIIFIYGLGIYPNQLIQLTESTIHYNLIK
jgi:NADH-ubiquinone oxidoreductase chain 4